MSAPTLPGCGVRWQTPQGHVVECNRHDPLRMIHEWVDPHDSGETSWISEEWLGKYVVGRIPEVRSFELPPWSERLVQVVNSVTGADILAEGTQIVVDRDGAVLHVAIRLNHETERYLAKGQGN